MRQFQRLVWCGWILWVSSMTSSGEFWGPLSGYDVFASCETDASSMSRRAEARAKESGQQQARTYACFPSNFDPRERAVR